MVCTPTGIWLDGETVNKFGQEFRTNFTDLSEDEKLSHVNSVANERKELVTQGLIENPKLRSFHLVNVESERYQLFVAGLKEVKLSQVSRR